MEFESFGKIARLSRECVVTRHKWANLHHGGWRILYRKSESMDRDA